MGSNYCNTGIEITPFDLSIVFFLTQPASLYVFLTSFDIHTNIGMSSNLETRISRNIARQKENFKRQQKIISSFNEDLLNETVIRNQDNNVDPSGFINELDVSLSRIRMAGIETANINNNGGGDYSVELNLSDISGFTSAIKDEES